MTATVPRRFFDLADLPTGDLRPGEGYGIRMDDHLSDKEYESRKIEVTGASGASHKQIPGEVREENT